MNVHPQKLEVRFRDPNTVHALVHRGLVHALTGGKGAVAVEGDAFGGRRKRAEEEEDEKRISWKGERRGWRGAGALWLGRRGALALRRADTRDAARRDRARPIPLFLFRRNLFFVFLLPLSARSVSSASTAIRSSSPKARRGSCSSTSTSRTSACGTRGSSRGSRRRSACLAEPPDAGDVRGDAGRGGAPRRGPTTSSPTAGFVGLGAVGPDVPRLGGAARDAGLVGPSRAPRLPRAPRGAARGLRVLAGAPARGPRGVARLPGRDHGQPPPRAGRGRAAPRGPRGLPRPVDVPARAADPPRASRTRSSRSVSGGADERSATTSSRRSSASRCRSAASTSSSSSSRR